MVKEYNNFSKKPLCARCGVYKCYYQSENTKYPIFCPHENYRELKEKTIHHTWTNEHLRAINEVSDEVVNEGYGKWCRIKEVIEYCKKLKYKRLGLAFCIGLRDEAKILDDILVKNGFEVISISCMAGSPLRKEVNLEPGRNKTICNPLMQAEVLNQERVDLNIMFGLCVGHDIQFIKNSKADVTPLIVKDRVLCHNPIGALYTSNGFYKKKLSPSKGSKQTSISKLRSKDRQNK
jgi:uncharacterized metal-binding protein